MTNLEKYPNTADAVKAWNEYRASGNSNISFENWLGLDYIEPLTLLEAAKSAKQYIESQLQNTFSRAEVAKLERAIESEELRLKHNFEGFATAEEAFDAFRKACRVQWCEACHLKNKIMARSGGYVPCSVRWLYSSDPNLTRNEDAERTGRAEEKFAADAAKDGAKGGAE